MNHMVSRFYNDPLLNQGMAFTKDERVMLGLRVYYRLAYCGNTFNSSANTAENFRKMPDDLQSTCI